MYIVETKLHWCSTHRLLTIDGSKFYYKNKCGSSHGHEYYTIISLSSSELNEYGFVVDFSDIKKIFKKWINDNWDHATIVHPKDTSLIEFLNSEGDRRYIMPEGMTTSAESMAEHLYSIFNHILCSSDNFKHVNLNYISIYETETNCATYKGE